jgi:predicted short-subunit dehydrogenase-like oxidoreductase (DUF2520 family)
MRELERTAADTRASGTPATAGPLRIAVVGDGRVGGTVARALRTAGNEVMGPVGRGQSDTVVTKWGYIPPSDHESARDAVSGRPPIDAVLLCVPDAEIAGAARSYAGAARFIGHTSGATPLTGVDFGLHPLQTIPGPDADLRGCGCAIAGTTDAALELARRLAHDLGMDPVAIEDDNRAAYHAAASIASNFLIALEAAAETVAGGAGLEPAEARRLLGPLVQRTVENWIRMGPESALTGPVVRGDEATVAKQREAVAETAPELLPLFDELVERTRALAGVPA